ncbi:MAG: polyphosphate polymerase domain-containing protein [Clostridia bacterium]
MEITFRKEHKYLLPRTDYLRIRGMLMGLMEYDKHGGSDGYMVSSLYFDSADDRDLYDAMNGNMEKRKVRLRVYDPLSSTVNLEFKCKFGSDGVKRAMRISRNEALRMLHCDYAFLLDHDDPLALTLYNRLLTGGYSAKTLVQYHRLAYTYPVSNVRITYDTGTRSSYIAEDFFKQSPLLAPLLPPDLGILEVKFNNFLPSPIKQALSAIDALSAANSKYAVSRLTF